MTAALTCRPAPETPAPTWPVTLQTQNDLQDTIHAPYATTRDRVILELESSPYTADQAQAAKMAGCADSVRFYVDPSTDHISQYLHRCKQRPCPFCAVARTNHVAAQLDELITSMARPRTIILTVKSRPIPLRRQLHDLRTWLAKLRRTKLWQRNVRGGAYVIEITRNVETGLWHPHIHILYDGEYIPFKALQTQWHRITGGSEIVWIAEVHDQAGMVAELSKYLGKPARLDTWPNVAMLEYVRAIRGTRLVQTFGNCHGLTVQDRDPNPEPGPDAWHVSLARLAFLASQGDDTANKLLALIAQQWTYLQPYIYHRAPQLEPDESKAARAARLSAVIEGRSPPPVQPGGQEDASPSSNLQLRAAFARFQLERQAGAHTTIDSKAMYSR